MTLEMMFYLNIILFGALVLFMFLFFRYLKKNQQLEIMLSKTSQELAFEKQHGQDREILVQKSQEQFQTLLESLSQKALIQNNQAFLGLAKSMFDELHSRAKIEMDQKQQNFLQFMDPFKKALEKVDDKIQHLEKEGTSAFSDLRRQIIDLISSQKELRLETSNLVKALRTPHARGQWGEMQLKRVIEMAGMLAYCDFVEQAVVNEGRMRPDVVVKLPFKKSIVIDAKTPLLAYLEALECKDDVQKQELLMNHARHVRSHISALSRRNYFEQFESSPEFVVMFIPGESIMSVALEMDPTLIEFGVQERVIMATPTTLIALLRAVAYGWQQESVAQNARVIAQMGRDFFKRLTDFAGHFTKIGKSLSQAVSSYNDGVGSFEKRVMVSARKFQELDPGLKDLPLEISSIDSIPRTMEGIQGEKETA